MRRYWDGHTWVDVDQVIDGVIDATVDAAVDHEPEPDAPEPPAQRRTALPRLVAQRRPDPDETGTPHG